MTNPRPIARMVPGPGRDDVPPPPAEDLIVLDANDPLPAATLFRRARYSAAVGEERFPVLYHQGGAFYAHNGTHYAELSDAAIRSQVWQFAATAKEKAKGRLSPFKPNSSRVSNIVDATRAVSYLDTELHAPRWLEERPGDPDPAEVAVMANGILHIPTRQLHDPTPRLYTHHSFTFGYDPGSQRKPEAWLEFLHSLFGGWSEDSIQVLQEMMGYLLLPDTSQQKAFFLVGPKRSGKGTIARIIEAMLGQRNYCGPTLSSLAGPFGLQPLIGKLLAVVGDARLGGRADQAPIVERILTVTGEDTITVDRKNMPSWTGRLPTRFLLLSNELPKLNDASGALISRFIVITLRQSFYSREDTSLERRLLEELPAIFDWALDGWERLAERGHFVQPEASAAAIEELEELSSPVIAFVRERCRIVAGACVERVKLYEAYRKWCDDVGRPAPAQTSFGRDLRAAFPDLGESQPWVDDGGDRKKKRFYEGIGLLAEYESAQGGTLWNR